MQTIRKLLTEAARQLEAAGIPDPALDAEYMLAQVLKLDRLQMLLKKADEISPEQERRFSQLLLLRLQRKPLQYIIGTQVFYGLTFHTDERALIPRQETEQLCETAIMLLKDRYAQRCTMLDLCTGSGAIAVTVKHECPNAHLWACDISTDALSLARENASLNHTEVTFIQGDLLQPAEGLVFSLIASNPPYVTRQECGELEAELYHEPMLALDGGEDGLDFYRRIIRNAPNYLEPDGCLLLETGYEQTEAVAVLMKAAGFINIQVLRDLYGNPRNVLGFLK